MPGQAAPDSTASTAPGSPGDDRALADLVGLRRERGEGFPRIALFLFGGASAAELRKTLERIPEPLDECFAEVLVMEDGGSPAPLRDVTELGAGRGFPLLIHRNPRDYGHGGTRQAAFEYALRKRFDHIVVMRGDGTQPPEALPRLLHAALVQEHPVVFASRLAKGAEVPREGMPAGRRLGHGLATSLQNRILGLRLSDYLTSFRIYPREALECIPFQLNSKDRRFDVELVIQLRALGLGVHEVPVAPAWREDKDRRDELLHVWRALGSAVGYRLHQLHVTRRGRYLVDEGIHYTLKLSETGSHMQIVDAIEPGSSVLDLGCSQGLLARPLRDKRVRVTGVDAGPAERLAAELAEYHQRDLELPLELPVGRSFDYVVCADVIEHLRNRTELLRSSRRYMTEGARLIISTPNVALWFYRLSLLVGRFEYGPRGVLDWTHVHLYTRATFRREVERAGFHILRERATALPFEVVFQSTGRSRLIRGVSRLYHALATVWPEMFAYQLILEAEITTLDEEATER